MITGMMMMMMIIIIIIIIIINAVNVEHVTYDHISYNWSYRNK